MSKVVPKKHLGQHFLKDENIASKIVQSLHIPSLDNNIIEIGPGTGILTKYLIEQPHFIAFDIDKESIDYLHTTYPDHREKVLHEDFLQMNLSSFNKSVSIIGNFPYNISSQLFFRIYEHRNKVEQVVCMVQKEVAQRIASVHGNKNYGILSVLLQAFFTVEYLFTVSPGVFIPPPKVQSGVIRLTRNEVSKLSCDEILFKNVIKSGFGQRRKTLRNSLSSLILNKTILTDRIFDFRAEQLSVADFIALTQLIENGNSKAF